MNNRDLCTAFAKGATGGKGSNMFIRGAVLFSYGGHWPLAIRRPDGAVFVNSGRYSVTTSKHRSYAVSALVRAGLAVEERDCEDMRRIAAGMVAP
jgi:hypothetical protein